MRDCISEQAAYALLEPVHGVEGTNDERLLLTPVPHCREEDERGLADTFEDAEQCADNDKACEVLAYSGAREDNAPRRDTL